jgi:GSPII_E N-terminal domain.
MSPGESQGFFTVGQTRIGSLLVEKGLITEAQLQEALRRQQQRGGKLGQILVEMKAIGEEELLEVLAKQLGVPRAVIPPIGTVPPEL